jgi:hypothetical protein
MRVISLTGATSVPDPAAGTEHEPGADGVFDLPEPFGLYLTTKHASMWRGEAQHKAAQRAALVEELRNPNVLSSVVADLRERVVDLEAQVAAHEARLSAKSARSGSGLVKSAAKTSDDAPAPASADEESGADPGEDGETPDPAGGAVDAPGTEGDPVAEAKPERARKTTAAKKTAAAKPPVE